MPGFTKWPSFQFLINPSTIFIISGMLASKEIIRWPSSKVPPSDLGLMNSTNLGSMSNDLKGVKENFAANHTLLESFLLDPSKLSTIAVLEIQLISILIQSFNNSKNWHLKFVDLPNQDKSLLPFSFHSTSLSGQRKANVLITDPQELVPIWVVVNLGTSQVESWTQGEEGAGDKHALSEEDKMVAGELALADEKVQEKIKACKVSDFIEVVPDVWSAGFVSDSPTKPISKIVQIYFYGVRKEGTNLLAYPFNFVAHVELGKNIVRSIEDLPLHLNAKEVVASSIPMQNSNLFSGMLTPNTIRRDLNAFKGTRGDAHNPQSFKISSTEELQR